MRGPTERLRELGLVLPPVATPIAAYVASRRSGDLVYTSGQLPLVAGSLVATGKVGSDVTPEQAAEAARVAALNALAAVASEVDGIDNVARVIRVVVYVASAPTFTGQALVANGASQLMEDVFGKELGGHVRSAVGVSVLPLDAPVEVELVVEA